MTKLHQGKGNSNPLLFARAFSFTMWHYVNLFTYFNLYSCHVQGWAEVMEQAYKETHCRRFCDVVNGDHLSVIETCVPSVFVIICCHCRSFSWTRTELNKKNTLLYYLFHSLILLWSSVFYLRLSTMPMFLLVVAYVCVFCWPNLWACFSPCGIQVLTGLSEKSSHIFCKANTSEKDSQLQFS